MSKISRYQLEVGGAKAFLAPLSFPVANAAMGNVFQAIPKYLSAGEIIINSLWVKGSPKLKEGGEYYDEACLQAWASIESIEYTFKDNVITIPYTDKGADGKPRTRTFKCEISGELKRETLEHCLGLIRPTVGLPQPLMAGKEILIENWVNGDKEIKEIDEVLVAACTACYYIIDMKGSSLKKV